MAHTLNPILAGYYVVPAVLMGVVIGEKEIYGNNLKIQHMKIITTVLLLGSLLAAGAASAQQTETRKVTDFTKLDIGGSFDAVLRQGNETSVKIITENIDTKKILTETNGNTLKVSLEKGFYKNIKIKSL